MKTVGFAPNEDQVFDILRSEAEAAGKRVEYMFLPPTHSLDRMILVGGNHVGNAECKSRTVPYTKYPTLMVDALKWDAMIASEQQSGLPTYLFYAFSDGGIYRVQPSQVGPLPVAVSTPRATSRSLNAGVERPVVHVPSCKFVKVAQAEQWPPKPTFVRPVSRNGGRAGAAIRRAPDDLRRAVETCWQGRLVPMHPGYPVNTWLRRDGTIAAWVDVADRAANPDGGIAVPASCFLGAARQETIFSNTPAWLVARGGDGQPIVCRPSQVCTVTLTVHKETPGYPEMVTVPAHEWVPLTDTAP